MLVTAKFDFNIWMDQFPERRTDELLKGRISISGARYFLTLVTRGRNVGLTQTHLAEVIVEVWRNQHVEGDYVFHVGTIMPDHIHLLITLGRRLELSKIISKMKALTKKGLAQSGLEWQRNYFDHRLRVDDSMDGFSRYIFLNPYRSNLIEGDEEWPFYTQNRKYLPEFGQHLIDGKYPPEEWIRQSIQLEDLIVEDRLHQCV